MPRACLSGTSHVPLFTASSPGHGILPSFRSFFYYILISLLCMSLSVLRLSNSSSLPPSLHPSLLPSSRNSFCWHAWAVMEQELRNQDLAVDLYQNALKVREGGREGVRADRRNDSPCDGFAGEDVVLTHLSLPPSLLQALPNSSHTFQAWACLEKERGNWELAFSLFRSGIIKRT